MRRSHPYAQQTRDAVEVLGLTIARARREQRRTATELAERAGISRDTLYRVEKGDPAVAIGTVFELATLLGIPLFGRDRQGVAELLTRQRDRLALLPDRVRHPTGQPDDAF